jgi:cytoplasmic iron level regulating protein YaaA (DUF328/UPF0246 family)
MAGLDILVLIPESTRKRRGGVAIAPSDSILDALPAAARERLESLRQEVAAKSPKVSIESGNLLPAHERFDGNMYRSIPDDAWRGRAPGVEVVIASGLRGLVASRDPIPRYAHSMAEPMGPFGKLNRWWHDRGLPGILAEYVRAVRPRTVVDLLSLEYRESVAGFAAGVGGIPVKTIDFPGMGRASQPRRGETIAEILRFGKV